MEQELLNGSSVPLPQVSAGSHIYAENRLFVSPGAFYNHCQNMAQDILKINLSVWKAYLTP